MQSHVKNKKLKKKKKKKPDLEIIPACTSHHGSFYVSSRIKFAAMKSEYCCEDHFEGVDVRLSLTTAKGSLDCTEISWLILLVWLLLHQGAG